jgi:hypothetical protein
LGPINYCEHSVPVSYEDYMRLPDIDGIITPAGMDAFECGRPTGIKMFGMWLCGDHADALERGMRPKAQHQGEGFSIDAVVMCGPLANTY